MRMPFSPLVTLRPSWFHAYIAGTDRRLVGAENDIVSNNITRGVSLSRIRVGENPAMNSITCKVVAVRTVGTAPADREVGSGKISQ